MWQLVFDAEFVKDAQIHQLLERQEYFIDLGVVDMIKNILVSNDELVDVTWCIVMMDGLNVVE